MRTLWPKRAGISWLRRARCQQVGGWLSQGNRRRFPAEVILPQWEITTMNRGVRSAAGPGAFPGAHQAIRAEAQVAVVAACAATGYSAVMVCRFGPFRNLTLTFGYLILH